MAKREFNSKGRFTPKGKPGKHNSIDVSSPKLAKFLSELESGSSVLSELLTATESVGGVVANETVFEVGTPLEDIIRLMLEGEPAITITLGLLNGVPAIFNYEQLRNPGEEVTVGGARFSIQDPQGEVVTVEWQPQVGAIEQFTEQLGGDPFIINSNSPNTVDTVDITLGGVSSTEPYVTTSISGSNVSKFTPSWSISMKDAEGNQIGNTATRTMFWSPPAFMVNIPNDPAGVTFDTDTMWISTSGAGAATFQTLADAFGASATLGQFLADDYYPIIRHTKSGNYDGTQVDENGNNVSWFQPDTITDTEQVGVGDSGATTTFFVESDPYRQLWFIPSGGAANTSFASSLGQGGGNLSYNSYTEGIALDIGQGGVGLSSTSDVVKITYNMYWLDNSNALSPGTTAITFNL